MEGDERSELEHEIHVECEAGAYARAATLVVEGYGSEIFGFLCARLDRSVDAEDVFAIVCEKLWLGLPKFEWRSSVRSWLYSIARNAALNAAHAAHRRPERNLALSEVPEIRSLVLRARTTTQAYRRTEVKDRFRDLRGQLEEEDQTVLILRVDKRMSWKEIVHVLADPSAPPSDEEVGRDAARLRKRFETIKSRLKELGRREGLLS